jgi:tRNA nucleotidyltransferase (CCA-adding enzyme)
MGMEDPVFNTLKKLYGAYGFRLYIVGGTARDLLLNRPFADRDYATDATPEEEKTFLPEANYVFAKYGTIKISLEGKEADVTTLRVEDSYQDFRHPGTVRFVKDPKLDYVRRDFTMNALYLDEQYQLLDYCGGLADLQKKIIRFVGDPEKRVQEDPLRILRAFRFADALGFSLAPETAAALTKFAPLVAKLNPEKIKEEKRKALKKVQ